MREKAPHGFYRIGFRSDNVRLLLKSCRWILFDVLVGSLSGQIAPEIAIRTYRGRRFGQANGHCGWSMNSFQKKSIEEQIALGRRLVVQRQLSNMEIHGMVERRIDKKGTRYYRLTTKGKERLDADQKTCTRKPAARRRHSAKS